VIAITPKQVGCCIQDGRYPPLDQRTVIDEALDPEISQLYKFSTHASRPYE